jgi:hypothetical protein
MIFSDVRFFPKMPASPLWLARLPELKTKVADARAPLWWDRAAIEPLFGLRRRQAIALLHQMGAQWIGRNLAIERSALQRFLADPRRHAAFQEEHTRSARVAGVFEQLRGEQRARQVAIPLPDAPERLTFAGLPVGVDLERQRLTIAFETPAELLEKLVALAQAMLGDFETFEAQLETKEDPA